MRKIFLALDEYRKQMGLRSKRSLEVIANIADPIVEKIRRQTEKVILIFMSFMEISLDRIMHKFQIEEFRRTNDRVMSTLPTFFAH
jgi:hypothetical protein